MPNVSMACANEVFCKDRDDSGSSSRPSGSCGATPETPAFDTDHQVFRNTFERVSGLFSLDQSGCVPSVSNKVRPASRA